MASELTGDDHRVDMLARPQTLRMNGIEAVSIIGSRRLGGSPDDRARETLAEWSELRHNRRPFSRHQRARNPANTCKSTNGDDQ